jgi:hypothetical protein
MFLPLVPYERLQITVPIAPSVLMDHLFGDGHGTRVWSQQSGVHDADAFGGSAETTSFIVERRLLRRRPLAMEIRGMLAPGDGGTTLVVRLVPHPHSAVLLIVPLVVWMTTHSMVASSLWAAGAYIAGYIGGWLPDREPAVSWLRDALPSPPEGPRV